MERLKKLWKFVTRAGLCFFFLWGIQEFVGLSKMVGAWLNGLDEKVNKAEKLKEEAEQIKNEAKSQRDEINELLDRECVVSCDALFEKDKSFKELKTYGEPVKGAYMTDKQLCFCGVSIPRARSL